MYMVGHDSTGKSIVSFISKITVGLCWHFTAAVFKSLASAVVISEGEQISGEGGQQCYIYVQTVRRRLGWLADAASSVGRRGLPVTSIIVAVQLADVAVRTQQRVLRVVVVVRRARVICVRCTAPVHCTAHRHYRNWTELRLA